MPHLSAIISADMPWGTRPPRPAYRAPTFGPNGMPPVAIDAPIGTRLMTSTPAAIAMSYAPLITPWAAKCADCWELPHWRSTLVAGTDSGNPAASTALRPMFRPCSPTCMTQPMMTSSTSAGSRLLRSTNAFRHSAARSTGCQLLSLPLSFLPRPPPVRTASTITALATEGSLWKNETGRSVSRRYRWLANTAQAKSRDDGLVPTTGRGQTAEQRLARLLELQALLGRVAREIGAALELEPVLKTILSAMRSLADFKGGTIQLVDDAGVYVAASDPPVSADVFAARLPVGSGLSGRVVATGESIYAPDLDHDERVDPVLRNTGSNTAIHSYLAVPLVVLGKVIGAVQVDSNEVNAFDVDDIAVLEGLATQVAGAIEGARRYEQVLELERMKGDFIARISHELRTPLTIMGGFADTLLMHGDALTPERHTEVLARIKRSVDRLSGLLEEILYVASLDAGLTHTKMEDVQLASLLREVRTLSFDDGRVAINCQDGVSAHADPVILRHMLNQLVDNALKYGGDATVTATTPPLTIEVRDHGPGIPLADRELVFQRFYRGNHTGAGMGLGLPVVRQLSAQVGATVTVGDAPDGGAVFTVSFDK